MSDDAKEPELDALGQPLYPYMDESGTVDLSQIDCNLALTPAQRIRRHNDFLDLVLAMKRAGEKLYGSEPADTSTVE
jgi:hypothetical protein